MSEHAPGPIPPNDAPSGQTPLKRLWRVTETAYGVISCLIIAFTCLLAVIAGAYYLGRWLLGL